MHVIDKEIKSNLNDKVMIVCKKINHIRKDKGLQQKTVATYIGFDQSSYNKVENGKWKPSVEILKKLSVIFDIIVDELLNSDNKTHPTSVTVEDKTVSEKISLVKQLEDEDKNVIYKMLFTMLIKKNFKISFNKIFQQNNLIWDYK